MTFDKIAQNERKSIRFPAQVANVTLHIEAAASVIDESRDGIGLELNSMPLTISQIVHVAYDGATMAAEIARIEPVGSGFCLGLRWVT